MNLNDQEIENVLRSAPKPKALTALRQQLVAQVKLTATKKEAQPMIHSVGLSGWLRRSWPALAPAAVSLACAAVMVSQEVQVRALQQSNRRLAEQRASLQNAARIAPEAAAQLAVDVSEASAAEEKEIARLKVRAGQLGGEVARLEKMQTENEVLSKQPVTPAGLSAEELAALAKAREKALSINCINNLKQIGLAARVWGLDHKDTYPPDFLSMSNELNTPKILVCPAETNRLAAATFAKFTDENCSYELLAPSGSDTEPQRVLTRCPIHGHIGLCDGSVQGEVAKKHPEQLIMHDKKLYLGGY
ncbi:MAG: hypothetical protein EXS35_07460 [Pedosphaera sp.]|nr:hypothetical protein [Pedosphaera sp.]